MATSQKRRNTENQQEAKAKESFTNSIRREINRLENVNKKADDEYSHQRKILLFNLFEKQYLMSTRVTYFNSQQHLVATIKGEISNVNQIIDM